MPSFSPQQTSSSVRAEELFTDSALQFGSIPLSWLLGNDAMNNPKILAASPPLIQPELLPLSTELIIPPSFPLDMQLNSFLWSLNGLGGERSALKTESPRVKEADVDTNIAGAVIVIQSPTTTPETAAVLATSASGVLSTVTKGSVIRAEKSRFLTKEFWKGQFTALWLKQFLAGGIAGAISRTVTSPLERMKILFQIQASGPANYTGVWGTAKKIWQEEGWRGGFRGNGTNVIRIVPYSAVQFAAYEKYKRMFMEPGKNELDTVRRLGAGALAGITSVFATYPLDIVRTRLTVQSAQIGYSQRKEQLDGIWKTMMLMYKTEGGVRALYRGLGPTLTGIAPYVALNFQAYEVLRKIFTPPGKSSPTPAYKLLCGGLAGTIAQTCTYPLDVLRRRMQVTGMEEVNYKYRNTWEAVRDTVQREGIRGMYKGIIPNYLKVAPAIGVSFFTYEWAKGVLGC